MLRSDRFDGVLQGQHIVCGLERIRKTEVDLVLAEGDLMMADFHFESHRIQRIHQLGAHDDGLVKGGKVEVSTGVMGNRVDTMAIPALEQEEFRFGTDVDTSSPFPRLSSTGA